MFSFLTCGGVRNCALDIRFRLVSRAGALSWWFCLGRCDLVDETSPGTARCALLPFVGGGSCEVFGVRI